MQLKASSDKLISACAFLISLALYSITLCRGIPFGDSAELALAATKLQIAHPPGYPLLTILGHLWSKIFFFMRPIVALNLLSAVFASSACAIFYLVLRERSSTDDFSNRITALAVSVGLASGSTLWSSATNFEVYSLGALFAVSTIYLVLRFERTRDSRLFLLAVYIFCLSLCNHLSLLSVAPAILILSIVRRQAIGLKTSIIAIPMAAFPLSLYAYLSIRTRFDIVLNWYDPQSWPAFKQQVMAEAYQRFLAQPVLADVVPYLNQLWRQFSSEFFFPIIVIASLGLLVQWKRNRLTCIAMLSIVLTNLILNFNYTISDIAPYFLPTIIVLTYWLFEVLDWLQKKFKRLLPAVVCLACAFPIVSVWGNFQRCDLSTRTKSEAYAHDLFTRVPEGGALFCASDNSMFPTLYLRYVENYRSDCGVYGHLPTLRFLQREFRASAETDWMHFEQLLDHAITTKSRPIVMARELMNYDNNYPRLRDDLVSHDLVYTVDSSLEIQRAPFEFDFENVPQLFDPKEAMLYSLYSLVAGETNDSVEESERNYRRAVEIVNRVEDPALSSALAAYFINTDQARNARSVLESALSLKIIRKSERLQLLSGITKAHLMMEDIQSAQAVLTKMLEVDPENVEARFQSLAIEANQAVASGDILTAIPKFVQMEQLAPEQYQVSYRLAYLYLQTSQYGLARSEFERCVTNGFRLQEVQLQIDRLDSLRNLGVW